MTAPKLTAAQRACLKTIHDFPGKIVRPSWLRTAKALHKRGLIEVTYREGAEYAHVTPAGRQAVSDGK